MNDASELILEMSETELRAVLLQLAGGARGRDVQDAAVARSAPCWSGPGPASAPRVDNKARDTPSAIPVPPALLR